MSCPPQSRTQGNNHFNVDWFCIVYMLIKLSLDKTNADIDSLLLLPLKLMTGFNQWYYNWHLCTVATQLQLNFINGMVTPNAPYSVHQTKLLVHVLNVNIAYTAFPSHYSDSCQFWFLMCTFCSAKFVWAVNIP